GTSTHLTRQLSGTHYGLLRPAPRFGTLALAVGAACGLSLHVIGVTKHGFSRSIRKPGRASRRLRAGCRSGSIRARRPLLHLSYSCAPQLTPAALVTHDPVRTLMCGQKDATGVPRLACDREIGLSSHATREKPCKSQIRAADVSIGRLSCWQTTS